VEKESEYVYKIIFNGDDRNLNNISEYKIELIFDSEYPNVPPKIRFITQMFHPNIHEDGMLNL
jgi:ubiquitin-protein ligase